MLKIEIVYAATDFLFQQKLDLPPGSTVADALDKSGIYSSHPETKQLSVGIFAKIVTLETLLRNGDRLEIYRPLLGDPGEKRRQRARRAS